jgi:HPt (histidine-containing phosphotransfer) domain-containing protein
MQDHTRSHIGDAMPGRLHTADDAAAAPAVDLVHLNRFTMGNRPLEREVLAIFVSQMGEYLDRLKSAGDAKAWREAAHTIKGSAWAIGAWKLGEHANAAERLGFECPQAAREAAILNISRAAGDVEAFIAKCLVSEQAA